MNDVQNSLDPRHPETASMPTHSHRSITAEFFAVIAAQLLVVALLAPGDGGRWLRYVATGLACVDTVAYFIFVSGGRTRFSRLPVVVLTLIAATIAVAVIVTCTIDLLHLS